MNLLSAVYGRVVSIRRGWYERPAARRRLSRPVISVGNLVVGGSGKTPVVAALARLLLDIGERPAILSRGYGRRTGESGVVVVSDGSRVLEPVERTGDEPQLLGRSLRGVPVLVSADRHRAGRVAESRFDSTVLLLDDGFQHLTLSRDVDLLIVAPDDLGERLLPAGALREPLAASRAAHALLVPGTTVDVQRVSAALGVAPGFAISIEYGVPRLVSSGAEVDAASHGPIVAVAGIARPQRFFAALRAQGWTVAAELPYRDHHWFGDGDMARVADVARTSGAGLVVTTEKDAVRLGTAAVSPPWAWLPMTVSIGPGPAFRTWIIERLARARTGSNSMRGGLAAER